MSVAGNIEAIRDWFNGTRFKKSEIDEFFIQNNDYSPYSVTIEDISDAVVTLTGQTSGKSYAIQIPESGFITKLLFFTEGETIIATDGEYTITQALLDKSFALDFNTYRIPEFSLKFRADNMVVKDSKDYSYIIDSDGYYLIVFWDFMYIQLLTVPDDVLISGQILDNYNSPHLKYLICYLHTGDEIDIRITDNQTSSSSYQYYSAIIMQLKNMIDRSKVQLCDTYDRQDGTTNYNIKNDNYKHLIVAEYQRYGTPGRDQTDTSVKKGEAMSGDIVTKGPTNDSYVVCYMYYGDRTNLPSTISNYSSGWGRGQLVDIIVGDM